MASEAGCGGEGGISKTWMRECWWSVENLNLMIMENIKEIQRGGENDG
jgi:hypothetical protein